MKKYFLLVILILVLGTFLRFYNFPDRVNFSAEQGLALLTSASQLDHFTFLGQRTFLRTTASGHIIFSGALYNWSLIPLLKIFSFDPLPITAVTAFLNILGGVVLMFVARKMFGVKVALLTGLFYMTSSLLIKHSLFIWILQYLPIISALSIYSVHRVYKNRGDAKHAVLLGLYCGLGVNFEYFYLTTLGLLFIFVFLFSKHKIRDGLFFALGAAVGNFTMLVFDLRNEFYNLKQFWQYALESLQNPGQSQLDLYHFFQYWPVIFLLQALLIVKVAKRQTAFGALLVLLFIYLNSLFAPLSLTKPVGMPEELTLKKMKLTALAIAQNNPGNFNIVDMTSGDFRSYALRYLTDNLYNTKSASMENYASVNQLYVFGNTNFSYTTPNPWEITVFEAKKQTELKKIDRNYSLFLLERI